MRSYKDISINLIKHDLYCYLFVNILTFRSLAEPFTAGFRKRVLVYNQALMKIFLYGLIIFLILIGACTKERSLNKSIKAEEILNVEYGTDPRHKFDIYLPEERTVKTKVIVFIYGSTWLKGDKRHFTDLAKFFRDKGYAAATINYRFTNAGGNNVYSAQVNDLGKAIDFISSKTSEWKISPDAFGVLGAGTGAHLGLLYTYGYDTNNKVKAVVSMAGQTNLMDLVNETSEKAAVEYYVGTSLQVNPMAYQQASPVFHVKASSKPTLLFHGKLDTIVPLKQVIALKAKLDEFNITNKLIIYEDTGHEVLSLNHMASFLAEVDLWFKENLK